MLKTRKRFATLYLFTWTLERLRRIAEAILSGLFIAIYVAIVAKMFKNVDREVVELINMIPLTLGWMSYSIYGVMRTSITGNYQYMKRAGYITIAYVGYIAGTISLQPKYGLSIDTALGQVWYTSLFLLVIGWIGRKLKDTYLKTIIDTDFSFQHYHQIRNKGIQTTDIDELETLFIKPEYRELFYIMGCDDMRHTTRKYRATRERLVIGFDVFGTREGVKVFEYDIPTTRLIGPLAARKVDSLKELEEKDTKERTDAEVKYNTRPAPKYRKRTPRRRKKNKTTH